MSDQDGQPFINDDGEHLGTWRALSNSDGTHGGWGVMSQSGELLAAVDEYDQVLDPATIGVPDEDFYDEPEDAYEDPRLAELQAQIAELEQRVEEPLPVYDAGPRGPSDEEIQDRLQLSLQRLESYLGRTTTDRERNELAERALEDGTYDLVVAAGALRAEGKLRDYRTNSEVHNHAERVAHATELLAEQDGSAPDALTGQPQREAEDYDMSTHEGRTARALDVMAGYDDTADTSYDSRTFEAE